MSARPELRLLDPNGVVYEDDPQSYAEALVLFHEERARNGRLQAENENISKAAGKLGGEVQRLKGQLNKDLRLHKDYATVERLWGKYREGRKRCGEQVPEDWLKMALARLKDFDEFALARALDGARHSPPTSDDGKTTYDKWDNVFRSTGHVHRYIERADRAEGKAHRERERVPEVREVLCALNLPRLEDLAARCECGHLTVEHTRNGNTPDAPHPCRYDGCGCVDADDFSWRSERWLARQPGGAR